MNPPQPSTNAKRTHRIRLVHILWLCVVVGVISIRLIAVPLLYQTINTVCNDPPIACVGGFRLTAVHHATLTQWGITPSVFATTMLGLQHVSLLIWLIVGGAIFVMRSTDRMALQVSLFLIVFGSLTFNSDAVDVLAVVHPAWLVLGRGLQILGELLAVLFFLRFPSDSFEPRWTMWIGLLFLMIQVPPYLKQDIFTASGVSTLTDSMFLLLVPTMLGAQVYRYRYVSTEHQRRQTKWVIAGTILAITLLFATYLPFRLFEAELTAAPLPVLITSMVWSALSMTLIPLSIGIAMLRSRLFDIDLIIRRTLVYGTLSVMLALIYIGSIVGLQQLFRIVTGQSSDVVVVASTLLIAALFQPLRHRIQASIDRRFYRQKYDAQKTLRAFSVRLRDETDLRVLSDDVLTVVHDTLQPAHASLWLKPPAKLRS
jgi:hypothetical protein